jgi:competence protein ComEA
LAELFPVHVQAALVVILFGLVLAVAWTTVRKPESAAAPPEAGRSLKVDINRADRAELMLLPGVGPGLADRILEQRARNGPFDGLASLREVPGMGPATLEKIRPYLVLSWPEGPAPLRAGAPVPMALAPRYTAKASKTTLEGSIDINNASLEELQRLPGIGPKLAQRIVETRERRPFAELADIRRVPGIGPKTLDKLKPYVTLGSETTLAVKVE